MKAFLRRSHVWVMTMATGGGLFVLEGCDPAVRDSVLTGVGSAATQLSTTFIGAFFESLLTEEEETATTVRGAVEFAPQIFC